jgi:hypothetical protein
MQAFMNGLSPGYFTTMQIPFLEGRDFRPLDAQEETAVAIVNRRFIEHFFKGESAVGKRIGRGSGPGTKLNIRRPARRCAPASVRAQVGQWWGNDLRADPERVGQRIQRAA